MSKEVCVTLLIIEGWWLLVIDTAAAAAAAESLAVSSAKASQKALWVMKLSFLEKRVPQSHLYSLVPQVLE